MGKGKQPDGVMYNNVFFLLNRSWKIDCYTQPLAEPKDEELLGELVKRLADDCHQLPERVRCRIEHTFPMQSMIIEPKRSQILSCENV
jgi:hypothetical protein